MKKTIVIFIVIVLAIVGLGLVLLSSASVGNALRYYNDRNHFTYSQLKWLAYSMAVLLPAVFLDYRIWVKKPWTAACFLLVVVVLLSLVFLFPKVNGSWRWLKLGSMRLQPSEFSKAAIVVVMCVWLDRIGWHVERFLRGTLIPYAIMGAVAVLLVLEPDYGSTVVMLATGMVLMFLAGCRIVHTVPFVIAAVAGIAISLICNPNRRVRLMAWWDPSLAETANVVSASSRRAAHQLEQGYVAIQRGGLWGVGYLNSMQKQAYLPEMHTDFIFAIGAEEMGILFSLGTLLLFCGFIACGFYISAHAKDRFGQLLAFGMTFLIGAQAIANICVVTGCLPTKGLALPMMSYGGTNLMVSMFAIGTILSVAIRSVNSEGVNRFAVSRPLMDKRKRV